MSACGHRLMMRCKWPRFRRCLRWPGPLQKWVYVSKRPLPTMRRFGRFETSAFADRHRAVCRRLTWIWGRTKEVQELQSFDLQPYEIPSETRVCSSLRCGRGRAEARRCERREPFDCHARCRCLDRGRRPDRPDVGGRGGVWGG